MLTAIVVNVHVIVSLGGGLSGMFGGGMRAATGSTVVERSLDRTTVAHHVVSLFTTVIRALRLQ